ncbi:MAG: MlaC/ttg2D family ABC transporter substrate-binding protein [Alphaproteobacteria bacterium]
MLGRYWKKASKQEQTEYMNLFEDLLVVTYVDRFSKYSGENLKVKKSTASGAKDIVVFSEIVRLNNAAPLNVDWRVRARDEGFKIIDVMVEGVSMGQTQRSEFASVIRQNGGKVEGLLVELRKRVSKDA